MKKPFKPLTMIERANGWCDWMHPAANYKMACCDCGLVHDMQFSLDDKNRFIFRARRNKKLTKEWRAKNHKGQTP